MPNTTFIDQITPITAEWLNDVNDVVYKGIGPFDSTNVLFYGAVGNGATDDTAAIQAAITANYNGRLYFPPGTYAHSGLTIKDNILLFASEPANTILRTRNGSNAHGITVAYNVVQNPILQNLTIDGSRHANSLGHGIYLPDHIEPDASLVYGFAVTLINSYVQNCAEKCIYVGRNRNYGRLSHTELKRGGTGCLYMSGASDWQGDMNAFGFPISGAALEVVSGAANTFLGGAAFGALDAPAVRITNSGSSPTLIHGMTINGNQREAVHLIGAPGVARHLANQISGCWFAENSLAAENTYSHIKITDSAGALLTGNSFRWLGSGNRCKYLVEFTGTYLPVEWVANSWDKTVNVTYGTGVSNAPTQLVASVGNLAAAGDIESSGVYATSGTATFDLRLGVSRLRALRAVYVASAVNWLDVYPSITGSPVQIAALGADPDIDLRLVPKGAGHTRFGTRTASVDVPVTGYIEIKDSSGTVRRLAVVG